MKEKSLKLINKNLQEYHKRMTFYKKRLEKTLSYLLFKNKVVNNIATAITLIQSGNCKINNRKIIKPNYICTDRDIITILTKTGIRTVKPL